MPLSSLSNIKKFFNSTESPEDKQALYKEMLLMTLARAAKADLVTYEEEVQLVQQTLNKLLDEEVSLADIRTAASSELFEKVPLKKYLERAAPQLDPEHNQAIVKGLVEVFGVDGLVSEREIEYFNMVASALKLSPAEIVGLRAG